MGFLNSWIAVQGATKSDLREMFALEETGKEDWAASVAQPFSYAELPDGWVVLFSDDFDWAGEARVRELSRLGLTLGCQLNDRVDVMTTAVVAARDGEELWRVAAIDDELQVQGKPPAMFASIRDRWTSELESQGEDAEVHEIPVELAKAICGFRADDDQPDFMGLRLIGGRSVESKPRTGCLAFLFAPFLRR